MSDIVGVAADVARVFYGNTFIPLYLSMKDRGVLLEKHGDHSDWVELKVGSANVVEVKKGNRRCWLMESRVYSAALYQTGYSKKNLEPINFFRADEALAKKFLESKKIK